MAPKKGPAKPKPESKDRDSVLNPDVKHLPSDSFNDADPDGLVGGSGGGGEDDENGEHGVLVRRLAALEKTNEVLAGHDVIVQRLVNKAREDLVWGQYMKCDGLPNPVSICAIH